jgi:hypothetical protein
LRVWSLMCLASLVGLTLIWLGRYRPRLSRLGVVETGQMVGTWMRNLAWSSFLQGNSYRSKLRRTSTTRRTRSNSSYQASRHARSKKRLGSRRKPQPPSKSSCRSRLGGGLSTSCRTYTRKWVLG